MNDSILVSVKKMLGIAEDYEHFDLDIMIHINSAFMVLTQLGIGPADGFSITSKDQVWSDFIPDGDLRYESVKTYVYMKTKIIFDPPTSSMVMEALKQSISEYEWRLNNAYEIDLEK